MSSLSQDPEHPDTWLIPASYQNGHMVQTPIAVKGVHLEAWCAGKTCLVHNPSDHHMRRWPLLWNDQRLCFERLCPHDITHPDPDSWGDQLHEGPCDGCCQRS